MTSKLTRQAILKRYKIKRWQDANMLLERAGAKGRKHYREPLTEAQAARLIEVCAEYAGSRYMGWVPGDDLSYYGHPVMRRKRPRKGVVGKR